MANLGKIAVIGKFWCPEKMQSYLEEQVDLRAEIVESHGFDIDSEKRNR